MAKLLGQAFLETLWMVGASSLFSLLLGGALGIILYLTGPGGLKPLPYLYSLLSFFVNAIRSIPYIILMVFIIPITRLIAGSSIGTMAAIVPLALAGLLLIARSFEEALRSVPEGLVNVGLACGASKRQIIQKILLPEALPHIIASTTTIIITLVGFSAMAGALGGGGLGDLAIRYGYQRYDLLLLGVVVIILILLVQAVQMLGDWLVVRLRKN